MDATNPDRPFVVTGAEIPISSRPEDADMEMRHFDGHKRLRAGVATSAVALAFVQVRRGEEGGLRANRAASLLVVLHGSARLAGGSSRSIHKGDTVMLAAHQEYGFVAVGPEGLRALQVTFRDGDRGR